jgi:hypothetical protein
MGQTLQIKDISLMKQLCSTCHEDFTSHSFNYVCSTLEEGQLFYTKISNASQYDDTEGIVKHCTNYLNHCNPSKWSWIIDFDDFGLKHTLGLNTGIQLSRLINRFGRLNHLIVINTNTFVEQMLKMIKLTLNKEYHQCIRIIHSKNEFQREIEQWTYTDEAEKKLLIHFT